MIASISGTIKTINDKYIVVETNTIGYKVFVTAETLIKYASLKQISLWTTHIVREDSEELFGFETIQDQELFELLLGISGIGPRSALAIMNVATGGTIARAVHMNDVLYLTKISGIGKKTAEKIILELRDKLPEPVASDGSSISHDVIDALVALGYTESRARDAVRSLDPKLDTQSRIREALKTLNTK